MTLKTVKVPPQFEGLFVEAERFVGEHFATMQRSPEQGTIHIGNERYVLVRAASLTTGFYDAMRDVIGEEEARKFWYRIARVIGRDDANTFCEAREVVGGPARLSAGPVHFAHSGWARVEIDERSNPSADDDYYLEYTHPNTFESETHRREGLPAEQPVCVFSAGYSAGWCSESFGLEVHAREVTCVAAGDAECRFVMGVWDKLDAYVEAVRSR